MGQEETSVQDWLYLSLTGQLRKARRLLRLALNQAVLLISRDNPDSIRFTCNICGHESRVAAAKIVRDRPSCAVCRSTLRHRGIIHALSMRLYGHSRILTTFPVDKAISGIGLTDWIGYAEALTKKFRYRNTYFHKAPKLDITDLPEGLQAGALDFVISSDVFEHVATPVSRAFRNAARLLKPGGLLVLTVPYSLAPGPAVEHFGELSNIRIVRKPGGFVLRGLDQWGVEQEVHDLVFHGGKGATLEMRVFTLDALRQELARAGFSQIQVHDEPYAPFGILWKEAWSLPISAVRATTCG